LLGQDGDEVISVEDWSDPIGTIPYEITCGFTQRLPRILIESSAPTSNI
jgi:alanine racemase